jgi:hypothetical protein
MDLEQLNKLWQSFRRWPFKTAFLVAVIIIITILFMWAGGYFGEKGRQAATLQSNLSPQEEETSSPKEITSGDRPVLKNTNKDTVSALIQKCNQPITGFKVKPEVFVPRWTGILTQLRRERTTYDLKTLMSMNGRAVIGYPNEERVDEAEFTLNCLKNEGSLKLIRTNSTFN